jgi:ribosome-associated protein
MAKSESRKTTSDPYAHVPAEVHTAIRAAFDKKALHVTVMDLRSAHAFTDTFLICSGQTARQVKAIVEAIEEALRGQHVRPSHVEGLERSEWVLMDYFDFVVHVFTPETRTFYGLERLWGSAVVHDIVDPQVP